MEIPMCDAAKRKVDAEKRDREVDALRAAYDVFCDEQQSGEFWHPNPRCDRLVELFVARLAHPAN